MLNCSTMTLTMHACNQVRRKVDLTKPLKKDSTIIQKYDGSQLHFDSNQTHH